ncbi:MAG: hypothetical protein NQU46_08330 [Methanolinea sp.]|nr:hypothetical protein [Methanolinea sp.]
MASHESRLLARYRARPDLARILSVARRAWKKAISRNAWPGQDKTFTAKEHSEREDA